MKVLITRPADDAMALAAAVAQRGLEPLIEPMLTVKNLPGPPLDLAGAQAVLFTSANGVRAFCTRTNDRVLPVFAVGDATADAAVAAGFTIVRSAAGTAKELAALVVRHCAPAAGRLIHASGQDVATDLSATLRESGYSVERLILYVAHPATRLSPALQDALSSAAVRAALFFSPRSGAIFTRLARDARVAQCCERVAALCISRGVANSIADVQWRTVAVTPRPNQNGVLGLLDQECAGILQS